MRRSRCASALAFGLLVLLPSPGLPAASADAIAEVDVRELDVGDWRVRGLRLRAAPGAPRGASLKIASACLLDQCWRDIRIACPGFTMARGTWRCERGLLNGVPIRFRFQPALASLEIDAAFAGGGALQARYQGGARRRSLAVDLSRVPIAALDALLPAREVRASDGRVTARLEVSDGPRARGAASLSMAVEGLAFSDPGGTVAGEKLSASLESRMESGSSGGVAWKAHGYWRSGEVFLQPWYAKANGQSVEAEGGWNGGALSVERGRVAWPGVGAVQLAGKVNVASGRVTDGQLNGKGLDLGSIGEVFIGPWLQAAGRPTVRLGGSLDAAVGADAQGLASVDIHVREGEVQGEGLRIAGLDASIPWRRDSSAVGNLAVTKMAFGRLETESFSTPLKIEPDAAGADRVSIPLLGSVLELEGLRVERTPAGEFAWRVGGALHPVDMARVTQTLGLPPMTGRLSASIPRIQHEGDVVGLDGALVISAFDGYILARGLRVVAPFGTLPRVLANVEARHLDLGMLTQAFSFGSITGIIDADVHGLEMASWRPLQFDARVASVEGEAPRRISQRAVQNLSSLGGAGAVQALQRSFLQIFESFGYERIVLSCALRNGVCVMDGAAPIGTNGFLIVKGAGIPSLNVIGYNRRVDWSELIARLKRVVSDNQSPLVSKE